MGLIPVRYARRIDADTIGIYDPTDILTAKFKQYYLMGPGGASTGFVIYANEVDGINRSLQWNNDGQFLLKSAINRHIVLSTSGTGKIKFGAYTAGAATDSIGSIDIIDLAGTTRKLMVQA